MKTLFCFLLIYTSCLTLKGQVPNVNISNIDKNKLKTFWGKFKKAVVSEDKVGLANVCNFPLNCDYCDSINEEKPIVVVTEDNFHKVNHRVFFTKYLKEIVSKKQILQIIFQNDEPNANEYNFSYPIVKPSKKGEGKQGFVTLKKIKNEFRIVSIWSIP
jgi:hypothetical protein